MLPKAVFLGKQITANETATIFEIGFLDLAPGSGSAVHAINVGFLKGPTPGGLSSG
jgi:hypothetical protein